MSIVETILAIVMGRIKAFIPTGWQLAAARPRTVEIATHSIFAIAPVALGSFCSGQIAATVVLWWPKIIRVVSIPMLGL